MFLSEILLFFFFIRMDLNPVIRRVRTVSMFWKDRFYPEYKIFEL